jgi:putative chitinase
MNFEKLKFYLPHSVFIELPIMASKFDINNVLRVSHFLGQCNHESGGFKFTKENLNYSGKGLMTTFPKYFPDDSLIKYYQRNPEKIANRVYAGRMGNGSEFSGDGSKYCGRGYIQITGKNNYVEFGKFIDDDLVLNPEKVSTHYPLLSAAWFFSKSKLNELSDLGSTNDIITRVTKKINGGTNGLKERIELFKKYYILLS